MFAKFIVFRKWKEKKGGKKERKNTPSVLEHHPIRSFAGHQCLAHLIDFRRCWTGQDIASCNACRIISLDCRHDPPCFGRACFGPWAVLRACKIVKAVLPMQATRTAADFYAVVVANPWATTCIWVGCLLFLVCLCFPSSAAAL